MTSEEYDQLTSEEIIIKIAEFEGYNCCWKTKNDRKDFPKGILVGIKPGMSTCISGPHDRWQKLPDYLNDSNAMCEAEKNMDGIEAAIYLNHLIEDAPRTGIFYPFRATLAQRTKAFVLTKEFVYDCGRNIMDEKL